MTNSITNEIWNHIYTPYGFLQLIMAVVAVAGFVLLIKRHKLDYDKPKIKILESFTVPSPFQSKIKLEITNPSNFENSISSFELKSNQSFKLRKTSEKRQTNIPLPKTSKVRAEFTLNFESVKNLRGSNAVLVLTDLKGSKIKKSFRFMPSYNRRKVNKAMKRIQKNV